MVEPRELGDDRRPLTVLDHAGGPEVANLAARNAHGDFDRRANALECLRALRPGIGEVEALQDEWTAPPRSRAETTRDTR